MRGYHRKSAIRALRAPAVVSGPVILTGRPVRYEPGLLVPCLRPIWRATDYACGQRLVAMLPEWIPAYEKYERRRPGEVREKLLLASRRTLGRLLEPLRGQGTGRSLTRLGTLLRQQIGSGSDLSKLFDFSGFGNPLSIQIGLTSRFWSRLFPISYSGRRSD